MLAVLALSGFEKAPGEERVGGGEETGYAFGAVEPVCLGGSGYHGVGGGCGGEEEGGE